MRPKVICCLPLTLAVIFALGNVAWSREPNQTAITVPGMHCGGCAKKIEAALGAVAGIGSLSSDVQGKIVIVTPMPQTAVSPRAMWEALEKAGKPATKLEGPSGSFTAKPQT